MIQQVRYFADAEVLTEDIIIAMHVKNEHSYVKVPSQLIDHPAIPSSLPPSSDDSVHNSENSAIGRDDEDDVIPVNSCNLGAENADYVMTDSSSSDGKASTSDDADYIMTDSSSSDGKASTSDDADYVMTDSSSSDGKASTSDDADYVMTDSSSSDGKASTSDDAGYIMTDSSSSDGKASTSDDADYVMTDSSSSDGKASTSDDADYIMADSSSSDGKASSSSSRSSDSSDKRKHFVVSDLFLTCNESNCHKPLISKPSIKVYGFSVAVTTLMAILSTGNLKQRSTIFMRVISKCPLLDRTLRQCV